MPKLHLTKVAFACRDLDMLRSRIAGRAVSGELRVATRMRPKRSAELVTVAPMPRRAHQGWRYLEEGDAPGSEDDGSGLGTLPPRLYGKLASLALV